MAMVTDPVCGMTIESSQAEAQHATVNPDEARERPRRVGGAVDADLHLGSARRAGDETVPAACWVESPQNRMATLLRHTDNRLGLVTNGESWMLVNARPGEPAGFANLWFKEPATFSAFRALLGIERFAGVADDASLEAMLERSATEQAADTIRRSDQMRHGDHAAR